MTVNEKTGENVGLKGFDCNDCSERSKRVRGCRLSGRKFSALSPFLVDFHKPHRTSLDEILFCPASIPGIYALQQEVFDCLAIREAGGLREYYGKPTAQLPHALVSLYEAVDAAANRFAAEIRATARGEG